MVVNVGDVVELVKLAYDLYQKGYLVAKAAPETFQRLVQDLWVVREILYRIHLKLRRNTYRPSANATLFGALEACRQSLLRFKPLVEKYKKLGSSDRSSKFRRLAYPFDENKIQSCRTDLQHATHNLNLALTADFALGPGAVSVEQSVTLASTPSRPGNASHASLAPSNPGSTVDAQHLLEQPAPSPIPGAFPGINLGVNRVQTLESQYELEPGPTSAPRTGLRSNHSPATSSLRNVQTFQSIESSSEVDLPNSAVVASHRPHPSTTSASSRGDDDARSSSGSSLTSTSSSPPISKAPDRSLIQAKQKRTTSLASVKLDVLHDFDYAYEHADVSDALKLDHIHRREIVTTLSSNENFDALEKEFNKRERKISRDMDLTRWLNYAVWWLLKSRSIKRVLGENVGGSRLSRSDWPVRVSASQASADFLKSCWILKNVIFTPTYLGKPVSNSAWSTFQDLASELYNELVLLDSLNDHLSDLEQIKHQNLTLTEPFHQAVEHMSKVPAAMDSFEDPSRWYKIDDDGAGTSQERVIFRTFVNAAIGQHGERRKTIEAPYMFILWSQHGRSEVLASLINQSGTVNLCSPITRDHLNRYDEHTRSDLQFEMSFPSQEHTILRFLDPEDLKRVLDVPRTFFEDLEAREPRQDEFLVFREGLESFKHADSNRKPRGRPSRDGVTESHSSCEVSLFVKVPSQCWKTERRLVVSSALDAAETWCHSFWLPLGDINVYKTERDVTLSWSDCSHFEKTPDGFFGFYYSFVYKPEQPNHTITVQFESEDTANEFCADLLRPWVFPFELPNLRHIANYGSISAEDMAMKIPPKGKEIRVWAVRDDDDAQPADYRSVVYTGKRNDGGFSTSVFFVHRDVDFEIEPSSQYSVRFPALSKPVYKSQINNYRLQPVEEPVYEDARWAQTAETFHFADDKGLYSFLQDLTKWDVKYSCRAVTLQVNHGIRTSIKQRDVIATLWENPTKRGHFTPSEVRLTLRWMGQPTKKDECIWTTIPISKESDYIDNVGKKQIVFKKAEVCHGDELDLKDMHAGNGMSSSRAKTDRQVALTLGDADATRKLRIRIDRCLHVGLDHDEMPLPYRFSEHESVASDSQLSEPAMLIAPSHRGRR